jgi:hypothetical protein
MMKMRKMIMSGNQVEYRAFACMEEYAPHRDRWIARQGVDGRRAPGASKVWSYDLHGVYWANGTRSPYKELFESGRVFEDDGTPFGMKVENND